MKRLLMMIMLLCVLAVSALAQPAESYGIDSFPLQLTYEVLDAPGGEEAWHGPVVARIATPVGQPLHVITWVPPVVHALDVNFDGVEDLAVMVSSGASNSTYRLFIWQQDRFVPVVDGTEEGLFNPGFYPRLGIVESSGTSGWAGALHEAQLYRWEGARLVPIRRAVCEALSDMEIHADSMTTTTSNHILRARVYDLTAQGDSGEGILFDEQYDLNTEQSVEEYHAFYQRERDALWAGLQ